MSKNVSMCCYDVSSAYFPRFLIFDLFLGKCIMVKMTLLILEGCLPGGRD